jgi:hypothetical protein
MKCLVKYKGTPQGLMDFLKGAIYGKEGVVIWSKK